MNLEVTLIVLAIACAVFAFAQWRSMQPVDPLKPRMVPWRVVILVSGAVGIFLLVHLVTMLGLKADRPSY
jgi:hypothetical protein